MVRIGGKPVLEHLVNHLNKAGISEIIVNVHKNYDKIFKYFGTRLLYLYEPTLLGEAGTERMLQSWLGDEYIVMNGDTLTNVDIKKLSIPGLDNCYFWNFVQDRYAGTKFVTSKSVAGDKWDGDGAYYLDIGTKKGLAKARRFFKCKRPS